MSPLSTATVERFPDIEGLRRLTKSIAMLDAIISPEWEYRYYSYDSKWGPNEEMASMRNGEGDDWFLLFDKHGAALKGFAHEFPLAGEAFAARIQEVVPAVFESFLREPAFSMNLASFCLWRQWTDSTWRVVTPAKGPVTPEADGSAELLGILDNRPETYFDWATAYYERQISLEVIRGFYEFEAVTDKLIAALNPGLTVSDVAHDAAKIGYPIDRYS